MFSWYFFESFFFRVKFLRSCERLIFSPRETATYLLWLLLIASDPNFQRDCQIWLTKKGKTERKLMRQNFPMRCSSYTFESTNFFFTKITRHSRQKYVNSIRRVSIHTYTIMSESRKSFYKYFILMFIYLLIISAPTSFLPSTLCLALVKKYN